MARPKKEPAESKSVMVNYTDYMNMQNWLALALQNQHAIASRIVGASNHQLSTINITLHQVQQNCRNTLQMSGIDENSINTSIHPHIMQLLQTDTDLTQPVEALGELQLPMAPPLPKIQKKKQRKPKDPNAPKRPVTAFFLYLAENKDAMAAQLGPNAKPGEIQQKNKDMWNSLSDDQQEKYKNKYRANFEKYREQLKEYAAQGGVVDPSLLDPVAPVIEKDDEEQEPEEEEEEEAEDEEEEDSSSSEETPAPEPPKKATKSKAPAPAKEASPEKKKKTAEPKKKGKTAEKSASPEIPKKKRKAEAVAEPEPAAADKKIKKKRKSAGYAGNTEDF